MCLGESRGSPLPGGEFLSITVSSHSDRLPTGHFLQPELCLSLSVSLCVSLCPLDSCLAAIVLSHIDLGLFFVHILPAHFTCPGLLNTWLINSPKRSLRGYMSLVRLQVAFQLKLGSKEKWTKECPIQVKHLWPKNPTSKRLPNLKFWSAPSKKIPYEETMLPEQNYYKYIVKWPLNYVHM